MSHLLTSLRKYPVGNVDPKENFLTEAFAFLLRNVGVFHDSFLALNNINLERIENENNAWKTQVNIGKGTGIFDMQWTCDNHLIVVENKINSGFGENQLKKYTTYLSQQKNVSHKYLITIAQNPVSFPSSTGVKFSSLSWRQIHKLCTNLPTIELNEKEKFLLEEFIFLLEDFGMGQLISVKDSTLKAYYELETFHNSLMALFYELSQKEAWQSYIEKIFGTNSQDIKAIVKFRWGRLGIDFERGSERSESLWNPSLCFAVLLDPKDHRFLTKNPALGPDLCLIFNIGKRHFKTFYEKEIFTNLYKELVSDFNFAKSQSKGWEVIDNKTNRSFSKWHPLIIRKPLSEVFENADSAEKQINSLHMAADSLLKSILEPKNNEVSAFEKIRVALKKYGNNT